MSKDAAKWYLEKLETEWAIRKAEAYLRQLLEAEENRKSKEG